MADSPVSYQDVLSAPNWANLISKRDMCCALFDMLSCKGQSKAFVICNYEIDFNMHVHCTALPLMKVESWKGKLLFRLHNTVCTATWLIHCKALHSLQGWSTVVLLGGIQYTGVQVCGRNTIWWECSYVGGRTTIWKAHFRSDVGVGARSLR